MDENSNESQKNFEQKSKQMSYVPLQDYFVYYSTITRYCSGPFLSDYFNCILIMYGNTSQIVSDGQKASNL